MNQAMVCAKVKCMAKNPVSANLVVTASHPVTSATLTISSQTCMANVGTFKSYDDTCLVKCIPGYAANESTYKCLADTNYGGVKPSCPPSLCGAGSIYLKSDHQIFLLH